MALGSGERYRLLIVDDERVIREGLKSVVDWSALGFEIGGVFASAQSALTWLEQEPADLLLADICMPDIDGLELIARAKELREDLIPVVISGYNDFEYARTAIDRGVFGYLLKPVREAQLEQLLARVRSVLDERATQRALDTIVTESDALRQLTLLIRDGGIDDLALRRLVAAFPTLSNFGEARVVLFDVVAAVVDHREADTRIQILEAGEEIESRLRATVPVVRLGDRPALAAVVTGPKGRTMAMAHQLFQQFDRMVAAHDRVALTAAAGRSVGAVAELKRSTMSAESTLQHRCYLGLRRLIEPLESCDGQTEDAAGTFEGFGETFEDAASVAQFSEAVINADSSGAEATVRRLFFRCGDARVSDVRLVETGFRAFVDHVSARLNLHGIPVELTRRQLYGALDRVLAWPTYDLAGEAMADEIALFMRQAREYRHDPRNASIMDAVDVISQNLAGEISLESLAERAQMSTSYFSRLFKHVVGEKFKDYVINQRIELAKQLLRDTSDKVYAVAEAVGFRDHHYFSDVFKRKTGITPVEYRHRSREGEQ